MIGEVPMVNQGQRSVIPGTQESIQQYFKNHVNSDHVLAPIYIGPLDQIRPTKYPQHTDPIDQTFPTEHPPKLILKVPRETAYPYRVLERQMLALERLNRNRWILEDHPILGIDSIVPLFPEVPIRCVFEGVPALFMSNFTLSDKYPLKNHDSVFLQHAIPKRRAHFYTSLIALLDYSVRTCGVVPSSDALGYILGKRALDAGYLNLVSTAMIFEFGCSYIFQNKDIYRHIVGVEKYLEGPVLKLKSNVEAMFRGFEETAHERIGSSDLDQILEGLNRISLPRLTDFEI